mgnify:CR=1 FL=1
MVFMITQLILLTKKNLNTMVKITLGIIGGGQLGGMLSSAANKLNIKTVIFSDDSEAPAKNFSDNFIINLSLKTFAIMDAALITLTFSSPLMIVL